MFVINEFHFLRPLWLIALPIFYFMIFLSYKKMFRIGNWGNLVEPHLLKFLATKPKNKRIDYLPWLLSLLSTLFLVALAGPVWEKIPQPVYEKKQARIIVLDLSYSMLANDVKPSRIDRVRFKLEDLLRSFKEGETGLICYAGDAFIISPLTNDPETIISMLPGLKPDIMPVLGSNTDIAIKMAVDLIDRSKIKTGHIILVTDEIEGGFVQKIKNNLGSNRLSILSVGKESGSPILLPGGNFLKDKEGNIVISKINKISLKNLNKIPNVTVTFMSVDDTDLKKIISSESKDINFEEDQNKKSFDIWKEEGPWLIIIALPMLAFLFRKGVLFGISFFIFFSIQIFPKSTQAYDWNDLWLRKDQQAEILFYEGKMEEASKIFENEEWRGVSAYRSGDYEKAIKNFSSLGDERSSYNLANAYAMSGSLEKSLEIYDKLLKKNPEHIDALYNRDLIKKLLNKKNNNNLKDKKKESGKEGQSTNGNNQKKQQTNQNIKNDPNVNYKNSNSFTNQNSKNRKSNEKKKTKLNEDTKISKKNNKIVNNNDEKVSKNNDTNSNILKKDGFDSKQVKNQVLEQWLRKIPDDPGRLLRNKMQFELQRRGKANLKGKIYW